jgi:hypothetical protein
MDTVWIVGIVVAIIFFAFAETYAFKHPDRHNTLSRFIASAGAKWPLSIWIMGLFAGILAAHFFWPWCGNPLGSGGG